MMDDGVGFFLLVFATIVLPYVLWRALRLKAWGPCVVLQITLGIVLGPTVLGAAAPDLQHELVSPAVRDEIEGLATLAVLFFAFLTGLHLDVSAFRRRMHDLVSIGLCSVLVPFCLGIPVAWTLTRAFPAVASGVADTSALVFATALALSVTALPVLAAILREMKMIDATIGQWSLGIAGINDAALWLLLSAIILSFGVAAGDPWLIGERAAFVSAYVLIMYRSIRPLILRLSRGLDTNSDDAFVGAIAFALMSAGVTELLGLHYLSGAFIAGSILPDAVRRVIVDRIGDTLTFILAPFFFVSAGLKMQVDLSVDMMSVIAATTSAAVLGKAVGTILPARLAGLPWRDSLVLGALLQAKGMMELVVLSILLKAGMLSREMFSSLVVMALLTTLLAMPAARAVLGHRPRAGRGGPRLAGPDPPVG